MEKKRGEIVDREARIYKASILCRSEGTADEIFPSTIRAASTSARAAKTVTRRTPTSRYPALVYGRTRDDDAVDETRLRVPII